MWFSLISTLGKISDVVVPARIAGTQIHTDVYGRILRALDAQLLTERFKVQ
ncbi:MAG TPA: hypothetical protein VLJ79_22400 [Candidatus Binatia bacterium]|nr:hypothetical protein [Candidatus Binatia bacterium]